MPPLELCFRVKPRQSQSGQIKNLHNQNKAIRPNQALGSRRPPQVFYRRRNCELDFEKRCPPLTLTASEMFIYFFLSFFPNSCSEIWSHDCSSSCSCHQQSRFAHRLIEDLLEDQFSICPTRISDFAAHSLDETKTKNRPPMINMARAIINGIICFWKWFLV